MIPDYPCERLGNSPLVQVIAQVRFAPFATFDRQRLAPFIDGVTSDFPFVREEKNLNVVVDPSGSIREQEGEPVYRFLSGDYQTVVTLSAGAMSLEMRGAAYDGIQSFARHFSRLSVLLAQLAPKKQLRFGLRFVNEVRVPERGEDYGFWYASLNREVLGYNAAEQLGGTVRSTVSEVQIARPDGDLRIRRGFLTGTTVSALQTPQGLLMPQIMGPFYLIDVDYFSERVVDFRPHDFDEQITTYNAFIFRVFHWIVGDGALWQWLRTGERFANV